MNPREANPAKAFFTIMNDGSKKTGEPYTKYKNIRYGGKICDPPPEKWRALQNYVRDYNYKTYGFTGNNCTLFGAGAGIAAGLPYKIDESKRSMDVPINYSVPLWYSGYVASWVEAQGKKHPSLKVDLSKILQPTFWGWGPDQVVFRLRDSGASGAPYAKFTLATPDAMREVLERLVRDKVMERVK
jgi:hypothetical protein